MLTTHVGDDDRSGAAERAAVGPAWLPGRAARQDAGRRADRSSTRSRPASPRRCRRSRPRALRQASAAAQNGYALDLSGDPQRQRLRAQLHERRRREDRSASCASTIRASCRSTMSTPTAARVIGMDFSAGAGGVAAALQSVLGSGFTVSSGGTTLTVLDDGAGNTTDVEQPDGARAPRRRCRTARRRSICSSTPAMPISPTASTARRRSVGFAGRIAVNASVLIDNTLLVKSTPTSSLGDPTRADYLLDQLQTAELRVGADGSGLGRHIPSRGTVNDLIAQTMNYSGQHLGAGDQRCRDAAADHGVAR